MLSPISFNVFKLYVSASQTEIKTLRPIPVLQHYTLTCLFLLLSPNLEYGKKAFFFFFFLVVVVVLKSKGEREKRLAFSLREIIETN